MNIYYQGESGSYSHLASKQAQKYINIQIDDIIGLLDFDSVWEKVSQGGIGIIPIENSYAGSIHHNIYNFLTYTHKIIGEYNFEVQHCLLSLEDDISKVKDAYSHHQALSQTRKYLKEKGITPKSYADTAGAAKMIFEKKKYGSAAVASELAGELYSLNILDTNIQDQSNNTTKFLVLVSENDTYTEFSKKKNRTTLLFNTNHTPGSLYHCLGILDTYQINMTKIESIPMKTGHFSYGFWVTFEGNLQQKKIQQALKEFPTYAQDIRIVGRY